MLSKKEQSCLPKIDPADMIRSKLKEIKTTGGVRGTSTGTGAQQTIAHGLAAAPNNVTLTMTATGATEHCLSAASDATNIYPTVTNLKTYQWYASVI